MPETPERIWVQATGEEDRRAWECADHGPGDTEYVRADVHPTYAQQAVCEALVSLYSADGAWLGEDLRECGADPYPRLWRLVQLVVNAPSPTGRHAPHVGLLRDIVSQLTGCPVDEVTEPLSQLLHSLRYQHAEDEPGMVVTDLEAWEYEGEEGG